MNSTAPRPLPNAADKATLKEIANHVILTCPGLQDVAHEIASDLLKQHDIPSLDPDHIYFHRFDAAQSSAKTFTGWEHIQATPSESTTLTQLVIQRFRPTDQDNADLLDLYGGFYTAGPDAGNFNETNEVRLHGNEVLKYFWAIDFSTLYTDRLTAFWNDSGTDFRTLAKCNFLIKAVQARDKRQLSDEDFQFVTNEVFGPMTWPVSLQMLQSEHPGTDNTRTLDVAGYVATNILRFVAPKGRQIVYLPGDTDAFQVLETATDMHYWMLQRMNKEEARPAFMTHFSLADRQRIAENITDLMNQLVSTWGKYDHHLINQENQVIRGDAFSWLRDSTKAAMFAEATLSLTSNGDLRKKLWIGYLSAGMKVFGPMAVVGWPIALPVVGASLVSMGLNIDQAVNGKTAEVRKAGIVGAVLSGIDVLFNLLALKGPGSLEEVGPEIDAAEAQEMADLKGKTQPSEGPGPTPSEVPVKAPGNAEPSVKVPESFKSDVPLSEDTLVREPGKFQGTYRLASNPSSAIKLNGNAYYVRFENGLNGRGHWAIIDPVKPNAFSGSIPVRLSAEGQWEIIPRLGLRGGMEASPVAGATGEPVEGWARTPGVHVPGLEDPEMRAWALGGPDVHAHFRRIWTIGSIDVRSVLGTDVDTAGPRSVFMSPFDEHAETLSEFELAQEEPRRNLISDANAYYELNPPTPRLPVSSAQQINTSTELLDTAFAEKPGLVVGEGRGSIGSKQFLIENMPALARQGVKTLYLQELLANVNQLDLDTFARTGEMPEELENYLRKLDFKAGNDPEGRFNLLALVKAANAQRVRVQAVDMTTTYNINESHFFQPDNQMARTFFASQVIQLNEELKGPANWVALVAQEHMTSFRGYRGISEQTDALSIRIDDVTPGQVQPIGSDPGLAVEYEDYPDSPVHEAVDGLTDFGSIRALIKGDWRVQMETPWADRTPQALRTLLSEPGMFTFQRYRSSLLVVYRNANNHIADSVIRSTPGGRINLDTPLGSAHDSITVDNFEKLKQTLIERGMKPMGWPDLTGEAEGAASMFEGLAQAFPEIQRPTLPDNWQANELLEGMTPEREPGKYQGIYRLDSNPSTAIMLDDTPYYVDFKTDVNGVGHWAIINPENPTAFSGSIAVRLNAEGNWETVSKEGLKGGGKVFNTPGAVHPGASSSTPRLPAPYSAYEVPAELRSALKEAADGLRDRALSDFYDSGQEFDPYMDFKAIRKRLYQDAVRFYEAPTLPPRPPIPQLDPATTNQAIIQEIFKESRGLVIGESHADTGSKQFLIDNMAQLARQNVKTLYMEHLLTDFHQADLDKLFNTGSMSQSLEQYLKGLDQGHTTDPLERYTFLEVVRTAAKHRIRVQAIDCMASYKLRGMRSGSVEESIDKETVRQKMMNFYARTVIRTDQATHGVHKWVALMGNSHANTYRNVAGVSELEEAIGLRIEDVAEGQSTSIVADPGRRYSTGQIGQAVEFVKNDLRLQVETPWMAQTMPEIETLLSRPGLYTLKQERIGTYLVHRSKDNSLVRTAIETDLGYYYINRPSWPSISGRRFPSIKALLGALDQMGMTLAGWSKRL
ncbi:MULTISPECIES: membrane-targeted effector domain-containing toxin [Pseudomonas]|uniref:Toxin n=1 Tax=Pseudomonas fluorescens TaxID=294 RepID=A0A166MV81_PSEFL|nr:toxin [Pseudomonas fluorescens]